MVLYRGIGVYSVIIIIYNIIIMFRYIIIIIYEVPTHKLLSFSLNQPGVNQYEPLIRSLVPR